MKQLKSLRWKPRWVSHLGCIKGCLDFSGIDISDAWLFGATGHAFIINMHEVVCPSGPTAWKEAKKRVRKLDSSFEEALKHYEVVAQNFKKISEMFPFPPPGWKVTVSETDEIKDTALRRSAVDCIREAQKAEEMGLDSLRTILTNL